ncbi:MAG TPA: sugar phosphate isomerase/epimerase family protein [Planctomycetaceae bacterium]|nr:sugar phosphate isomerase/epimerase family protein [Planctomycetaceae bacterium]
MSDADLRICFSTLACPDWTWFDVVKHGPEYGYQGVEIRLLSRETNLLQNPDLGSGQRAARRQELKDAGFQVAGLASSVRFDAREASERANQLEQGRRYIELAADLGAEFIRVFGDQLPDDTVGREAVMQQIADGLRTLGEAAQPAGVQILLETHGDFSASPPAAEVMRRVNHPHVGLVWDTHHPWRFFDESLAETWPRLRPWTRHTHWKDSVRIAEPAPTSAEAAAAAQAASALMGGHRHADYVLFGGGEFPARECLQRLLEGGYTGWYSLEWEKMWHPDLAPPETALPLFPNKLREMAACL